MNFFLPSSNVEKVGGGLNIAVKSEPKRSYLAFLTGGTAVAGAAEESREYQVRIEQNRPGAGAAKRRKNNLMDLPPGARPGTSPARVDQRTTVGRGTGTTVPECHPRAPSASTLGLL